MHSSKEGGVGVLAVSRVEIGTVGLHGSAGRERRLAWVEEDVLLLKMLRL